MVGEEVASAHHIVDIVSQSIEITEQAVQMVDGAVLVFAALQAVLSPFVFNMARKYASAVLGGIGIVSTLLALWIASMLTAGGFRIDGVWAWVLTFPCCGFIGWALAKLFMML